MKKDCPQLFELLVDYLEGELPEAQCTELEQHIGECAPCEIFLENYRKTGHICKDALLQTMPEPLENALLDFLKAKLLR